jgi:hypothetical protein
MSTKHEHRDRPLALLAFLGSVLLAGFWALYLSGQVALGEPGSAAVLYEEAFPVADALIALLLFGAGTGLWTGRPGGRFAMTAAASMVLYLGVLDLTFYTRQGVSYGGRGAGALELGLSLCCLTGGVLALVRCWRHRRSS